MDDFIHTDPSPETLEFTLFLFHLAPAARFQLFAWLLGELQHLQDRHWTVEELDDTVFQMLQVHPAFPELEVNVLRAPRSEVTAGDGWHDFQLLIDLRRHGASVLPLPLGVCFSWGGEEDTGPDLHLSGGTPHHAVVQLLLLLGVDSALPAARRGSVASDLVDFYQAGLPPMDGDACRRALNRLTQPLEVLRAPVGRAELISLNGQLDALLVFTTTTGVTLLISEDGVLPLQPDVGTATRQIIGAARQRAQLTLQSQESLTLLRNAIAQASA